MGIGNNAVAGPSSEGAIPRRPSRDSPSPPRSPSSAPPTPSVISVTHPSQFIHTHHPRRGSMTPLGLNLISPVAPPLGLSPSRSVGFSPNYAPEAGSPMVPFNQNRRGSNASTTSTLTSSRPLQQPTHSFYPPGWNSGRRRSSLTPSNAKVAGPSPTRAHVSGQSSRPVSSDGPLAPDMKLRNRTSDIVDEHLPPAEVYGRRGSLPHMGYGGWAGPNRWNPVLPPPRGSVGEGEDSQLPDEDFKFGSGVSPTAGSSLAAASLRAVDTTPNGGRRASIKRRDDMDAFEQTEADEADKQQRAFLAATYGQDGRRARERLSIGGQSGLGPPGTPQGTLRRQSLLLWERMKGMEIDSASAPNLSSETPLSALGAEDLGPRRGSLPIAIPGGGLGRSPSRRSNLPDGDHPGMPKPEGTPPDEEDEDDEEHTGFAEVSALVKLISTYTKTLSVPPQRPLPPLLPLSDPGPRLLPSTLALHRANHLLTSRNLQAEPLPHPLPPSLHPPAPVDVAEFDIDFILAGSQAQLGGQGKKKNAQVDTAKLSSSQPETPILRLGGDEEDTFAKFVGEFDDEYGGRRGDWTFRACPSLHSGQRSPRDPLDHTDTPIPKAEWESTGAGKYELFSNGEVRSVSTGRSWRVYKLGAREYELEEVKHSSASAPLTSLNFGGDRFTLAGKKVHRDQGGVKLPHFNVNSWLHTHSISHSSQSSSSGASNGKSRTSMSNSPMNLERTTRFDSEDSTMTMTPALSQSAPFGNAMAALKGKKKRGSKEDDPDVPFKSKLSLVRSRSREPEGEKKDKKLGGVFKRGLLGSMLGSSSSDEKKQQREERERERAQSHSWSGTGSASQHQAWSSSGRSSDGNAPSISYRSSAPPQDRSNPGSVQSASSRSATSGSSDDGPVTPWNSTEQAKTVSSATTDDETSSQNGVSWKEGCGWHGVPDDAVAMIVPLERDVVNTRPPLPSSGKSQTHHPFFADGPKQALLVWYVPFNSDNSETDDGEQRPLTASSRGSSSNEPSPPAIGSAGSTPSLPKFQKLLRRRASKDKEALKRETQSLQQPSAKPGLRRVPSLQPLPFRSFRVVARVVDAKELRSNIDCVHSATASLSTAGPFEKWANDQSVFASRPPSSSTQSESAQLSPVDESEPKQPDMSGRNFPTVIAVCHSRSQGVEFVLEGLDRLGLCKGESAWGPTGYEEWRGTGLSERGRELLDLLWAGCTGVMGLSAL
ncbi:hypothetical protein CI109_100452 [Kwoniella shandongensis]|uniref:Uncharacterized protein n=1 Tax=Kwoniella shandongensis TaxID=1734106 RepID=A0AAJ8LE17_9TREE